jgi:IstB-like ATP binding protein
MIRDRCDGREQLDNESGDQENTALTQICRRNKCNKRHQTVGGGSLPGILARQRYQLLTIFRGEGPQRLAPPVARRQLQHEQLFAYTDVPDYFPGDAQHRVRCVSRPRRIEMGMGLARFPFARDLASFDFAARPSIDRAQIREIATARFVANGEAVLFLGRHGPAFRMELIARDFQALPLEIYSSKDYIEFDHGRLRR